MSPNTVNTKKSELAAAAAAGRAAAASDAPASPTAPSEEPVAAAATGKKSPIAKKAKAPSSDAAAPSAVEAGEAVEAGAVAAEDAVVTGDVEETAVAAADKLAADAETVDDLISSVTALLANLRKHRSSLRVTMKNVTALQKAADKKTRKPRRASGASGDEQAGGAKPRFGNPVGISPELAAFMGIPADTLVHRNDATNFVHKYVISNNLRMETNKRIFIPDAALKTILADNSDSTEIGYFNLQKFIKHNFHTNK
ncbi:hypothetical protein FOA52_001590 [Chlamydomonas sp. UWO 241]|nr:hypothetical protein FOA52_001590 [Chlamydomonas sp. UWO 241]